MTFPRYWLPALATLALFVPASGQITESPSARWRIPEATSNIVASNEMSASDALPADDGPPAVTAPQQKANTNQNDALASTGNDQGDAAKSHRELAEKQLRRQEKQRALGLLPQFNVSYDPNAVSLTGGQKVRLALHTSLDPFTFATAFLAAGYHELRDDQSGFPWGVRGYSERWGAAYLDSFDSNMIGNGLLPWILHQEPRYFRLGHGNVGKRLLYASATSFICKHDSTGKWEPNYSNIGGNIAAGAISNLYYPGQNSGVGLTITNGMIVTAEGMFGATLQEFWPDISRKFLHRDPTRDQPR
ncbi:MAG: hypothetical protein P4M01_14705 [Acidobacteriota bacterium]|nr:hypothetical protein [Acidobacteriota bacterium]